MMSLVLAVNTSESCDSIWLEILHRKKQIKRYKSPQKHQNR